MTSRLCVKDGTSNRAALSVTPNGPNRADFEWLSVYAHLGGFPLPTEEDSNATIATHFLSADVHLEVQESYRAADQGDKPKIIRISDLCPGEELLFIRSDNDSDRAEPEMTFIITDGHHRKPVKLRCRWSNPT
jgi:hypothetical protein